MPHYPVNLTNLEPIGTPLLQNFGSWLVDQEYGSLNDFALRTGIIPPQLRPDAAERLNRDGFAFLEIPDGSLLILLQVSPQLPRAVVYLGSEGETEVVATSLEGFLWKLAQSDTGIADLDGEDGMIRSGLMNWLNSQGVVDPKAPPFDFDVYLDGGVTADIPIRTGTLASKPTIEVASERLQAIVEAMGRRADDPRVIELVTHILGKSVPSSTTDASGSKNVSAPHLGIELNFTHTIKNENYPPVMKSKTSFVLYLSLAWINTSFPDTLPLGLRVGMSADELTRRFGSPPREIGLARRKVWELPIDSQRDIYLEADLKTVKILVHQAQALSTGLSVPPDQSRRFSLPGPLNED